MMAKKIEKLLSLILALSMVMSLMSVMASAEGESYVWDEETKTLTLSGAELTEKQELPDGATIILTDDSSIKVEGENAIESAGAVTIKGTGKLTLSGSNGIKAASVSIEDVDVDFTGATYGIQVYNDAAKATVELKNVDGAITGGYAGIYVNGECADTEAFVTIDGCDLDATSTATSWNNRALKSGITVYVSVAEKVESSINITNSNVNATGFDAGLSINNYLGDDDATNSASSCINITNSTVTANGTNGTWAGIFASVLGQHPDADAIITITNSSVYAVSPNTGILTSSQAGESKIILDNSVLGASGKTALSMIEETAQAQAAELKNGSTYIQMTPDAVMKGEIANFDGKTIIASEGAITYNAANNYYVIPQNAVVTEKFTDGTENVYTFNNQAGGVGGFNYDKEEIWGYDVVDVCYIEETGVYYDTLTEAVADANELEGANNIVMLKDIDFDSDKALSVTGDLTITGAKTISRGSYTGTLFTVNAGTTLALEGITIDGGNNWTFKEAEFMAFVENGTKCPANSYYATNEAGAPVATAPMFVVNGKVELGNGATIQNNSGAALFQVNSGATLETLEGSLIQHNTRNDSSVVAKVENGGTWNIKGGKISDTVGRHHGAVARVNGELYMSGGEICETYSSDSNGSVFYNRGYMELNGGEIHDNYALYSSANSNNGAIYVYYDSKFVMNGGTLRNNFGSQPSGIISNFGGADAEPNTILNGGKVIGGVSGVNFKGHDVTMVNPVHVTNDMLVGESRFYNDVIIDEGKTFNANDVYFHGWIVSEIGTQDYTGGGTIKSNVTLYSGAEVIHHEGTWEGGRVTVDAIGTDTTLTVKSGAVIKDSTDADLEDSHVRVLTSVASGDHTNAEETTARQAAAYVEEDGANVSVPVRYYHRLASDQKNAITVTYDYNGGLDANGWSGCQKTSEAGATTYTHGTLPAPTREGYVLAGWKYAVDNEPETLDMSGTEWLTEDAAESASVRLVAQWGYTVTYTDGVEGEEVFADQVISGLASGAETPAFEGTPSREGYTFKGWSPEVADTVTADVVYIAQWVPKDEDATAYKKATNEDGDETYQIEIRVPGIDGITLHDEVILMVDGSRSSEKEWPEMKEAINEIGKTVLNGSGNTQLTLMTFGMGDNIVLQHIKSTDELKTALENKQPGDLLYGRTDSNCEAGFDGVAKYIENHDDTLNEAHVIYISDGEITIDETPMNFFDWKTFATGGNRGGHPNTPIGSAKYAFEPALWYGHNVPEAVKTVFGDRISGMTNMEILDYVYTGGATDDDFLKFMDEVYKDVYAHNGLKEGTEYPVSVMERAFVKYDEDFGTNIQDVFYAPIYKSPAFTHPNKTTNTPTAADELAAMKQVSKLYVVDTNKYTAWMDTGITSDNSTYIQSDGVAGLCDALQGALTDMSKTPFNDVVVTDYMSKWVNLDPTTLKIRDNSTGEIIWNINDGWLIDEGRPTAQEIPVVVELVDPADYPADDEAVAGNAIGDIYKLTWYVKDGAMLRADTYSLLYEVTVDTAEPGFENDVDYPANGKTTLTYKDGDGEEKSNPIVVPDVEVPSVPGNNNPPAGPTGPVGPTTDPAEPEDEIDDPDVPLGDAPEEEIDDSDTPLAGAPEEELFEEDVPMADVPETGDMSAIWAAASVVSAAGVFFLSKKNKDEE